MALLPNGKVTSDGLKPHDDLREPGGMTWLITWDEDALDVIQGHDQPVTVLVSRRESFNAAHQLRDPGLSDDENRRLFGKCVESARAQLRPGCRRGRRDR